MNGDLSSFHVIQIEDEVEFLVHNLDYLVDPDTAINSYQESRKYLYAILFFNIVFEILMTIYIFQNELMILHELEHIYMKKWHLDKFK